MKAQASRVRCLDRGGHHCQNLAERDSCWNKVLAFGAVFGPVLCGEELDVSREAADETFFHNLGLVSQDVERHSSSSAGSQRATILSFCVQRL